MTGTPARWWVALPDADASTVALRAVAGEHGGELLTAHPSGRPWLWGRLDATRRVEVITCSRYRVAFVTSRMRTQIDRRAVTESVLAGRWDELARQPGVDWVAVSAPDRLDVYGDAVGRARVAWGRREGVVLVASHQRVLAGQIDLDQTWLACQLLDPVVPHALTTARSAYPGVVACPAGTVVTVTGPGEPRVRRWWHPPEPLALELGEGAWLLRSALETALGVRLYGSVSVAINSAPSCALAVLAGQLGRDVAVLAVSEPTDLAMDGVYYRAALGRAVGVDRRRLTPHDLPTYGSGLDRLPALDEPTGRELAVARLAGLLDTAMSWGAGSHLDGHGGNDALLAPHGYLHRLGGNPEVRQRHLHGWAYPLGTTPARLAELLQAEPDDYAQWVRGLAETLDVPPPHLVTGWEPRVWLPPWIREPARQTVRELLLTAADTASPLAEHRDQHAAVAGLQVAGRIAGLTSDLALHTCGIPVECPYLDLAVVEACLATASEVRTDPWKALPLLTAAVPGLVEPEVEHRVPGPTYTVVDGLLSCQRDLDRLATDGVLADLGLIDPDVLRLDLKDPGNHEHHVRALTRTLALEAWLQAT